MAAIMNLFEEIQLRLQQKQANYYGNVFLHIFVQTFIIIPNQFG